MGKRVKRRYYRDARGRFASAPRILRDVKGRFVPQPPSEKQPQATFRIVRGSVRFVSGRRLARERRERLRAQRIARLRRKFGPPGPRILKRDVPHRPRIRTGKPPRGSHKHRIITGILTRLVARSLYPDSRSRRIVITPTLLFSGPRTLKGAKKVLPEWEQTLLDRYEGRLQIISLSHRFIRAEKR